MKLIHAHRVIASAMLMLAAAGTCAAGELDRAKQRTAIERGLKRLEQGATSYTTHRQCFSCHHQALPMMAMVEAKKAGFAVGDKVLQQQSEFTLASFKPRSEDMVKGQGIGGASLTVGYGLDALAAVDHKPDSVTDAMVKFLLVRQKAEGFWPASTNRPPSEGSSFSSSAVALWGFKNFGTPERKTEIRDSTAKARAWLKSTEPKHTEDSVFRFYAWLALDDNKEELKNAADALLKQQREDGGWSQLDSMESDAYATGSVIVVLRRAGIEATNPALMKGIEFLMRTQRDDGAWIVPTRSRPVQTFFDNGDPGEKSQFISFAATGWGVRALIACLPER